MIKRVVLIVFSLLGLTFSAWALQTPAMVAASTPQEEVCKGIAAGSGSSGCASNVSLTKIIRNVINIFSIIIGIVAVIMVMVAGFKYITAAGDSSSISSAKSTIIYAIVGLVVAALAQFIVQFVLDNVN